MKTVAVVGSRTFPDLDQVVETVKSLGDVIVVSGGARGVDRIAEATADRWRSFRPARTEDGRWVVRVVTSDDVSDGFEFVLPPSFASFAQAAHFRNDVILNDADSYYIFWDGESPGTRSVIQKAETRDKPMTVITAKKVSA